MLPVVKNLGISLRHIELIFYALKDHANDIRKIMYLNGGETYEDMIDRRSYTRNLSSCEINPVQA